MALIVCTSILVLGLLYTFTCLYNNNNNNNNNKEFQAGKKFLTEDSDAYLHVVWTFACFCVLIFGFFLFVVPLITKQNVIRDLLKCTTQKFKSGGNPIKET